MQIELLRPGVEGDVGPLAWLDAPNQFPNYVLPSDTHPKTGVLYQNRRTEIKRTGSYFGSWDSAVATFLVSDRQAQLQSTAVVCSRFPRP